MLSGKLANSTIKQLEASVRGNSH